MLNPTANWNENFNALLKYKALSGDVNIQTKKEVFGIELTDSQAKSIFEPSQEAGSGF